VLSKKIIKQLNTLVNKFNENRVAVKQVNDHMSEFTTSILTIDLPISAIII